MNNETYATQAYRRQIYYWFYDEYHHPLAAFRSIHGLDKSGADDFSNRSHDGISNLMKYAFNLASNEGDLATPARPRNLTPGGTSGLPTLFRDPSDGTLHYQWLRRKAASDPRISYETQRSIDLGGWSADPSAEPVESIDSTWECVTITLGSSPRSFRRSAIRR